MNTWKFQQRMCATNMKKIIQPHLKKKKKPNTLEVTAMRQNATMVDFSSILQEGSLNGHL